MVGRKLWVYPPNAYRQLLPRSKAGATYANRQKLDMSFLIKDVVSAHSRMTDLAAGYPRFPVALVQGVGVFHGGDRKHL